MFKIVICDDDYIFCNELEEMINDILSPLSIKHEIEIFYNGISLYNFLKNNYYDLIFMDIELEDVNGIDTCKWLRKDHNPTNIVFISANEKYALDLFKVQPLDFLVKPITPTILFPVLKTAYEETINNKKNIFTYKIKNETFKIPAAEILYFESMNRQVVIHKTDNTNITIYGILSNIEEKINKYNFLHIHKSYLVNYKHICKIESHQITLFNGTVLPISQNKRKSIRELVLRLELENFNE